MVARENWVADHISRQEAIATGNLKNKTLIMLIHFGIIIKLFRVKNNLSTVQLTLSDVDQMAI